MPRGQRQVAKKETNVFVPAGFATVTADTFSEGAEASVEKRAFSTEEGSVTGVVSAIGSVSKAVGASVNVISENVDSDRVRPEGIKLNGLSNEIGNISRMATKPHKTQNNAFGVFLNRSRSASTAITRILAVRLI